MEKNSGVKKRQRIGPIGETILLSMVAVGTVSVLMFFPMLATGIAPFLKKKKYSSKQAIQRNVESLITSGLVKRIYNKDGSIQLELTKKGKWEALLRSKSHDTKKAKWDKIWRVVIFDVPQTKYKIRDELRRAMMLYGFKRLQLSVWVYPHACDDFIEVVKDHLGVANDVLYMKVGYIENDKHLRSEFNLV